jgi:hypothetical protein
MFLRYRLNKKSKELITKLKTIPAIVRIGYAKM